MASKTRPRGELTPHTDITWKDADDDIVATHEFLEVGLCVNWSRPEVLKFKSNLNK